MASVGEVDERALIVGRAGQLPRQRLEVRPRMGVVVRVASGQSRIAEPRAEADVEDGQDEGHGRRGVIALIRAGRSAGDSHCRPDGDAILAAILLRVAVADVEAARMQRRDGERLRLALLPGQLFAGREIERGVDDVHRCMLRRAQ